ncbi:MAG: glutamine-hydrolyzing carbamoyl-phosphate synthase small subunit [Bdellovibrionota bacterium]
MSDSLQPKALRLILEKGFSIDVEGWGDFSAANKVRGGEFVFCTAMTGMEESLTDPSFCRQVIVSTVSHVGNTGFTEEDMESHCIWAEGLVLRHLSSKASSWRAKTSLLQWVLKEKKFLLHKVDTRLLAIHLRNEGSQRGVVFERGTMSDSEALASMDKCIPPMKNLELLSEVTCAKSNPFEDREMYWPQFETRHLENAPRIALLDYGVKTNTPRILSRMGCEVILLPAKSSAADILEAGRDGIFLSNGPGDPEAATQVVAELKKVIGKKPLFGICMGHQLLALALGAKTYKLKFGHRGIHHPVVQVKKGVSTGKTLITSQNHGFAVDEDSLPQGVEVTFRHANDLSNEGICNESLRCSSVQFHPEAAPGPFDGLFFFEEFLREVLSSDNKGVK